MKNQFKAMLGVFTNPKRTMQELPSDRLYALAILAPVYFGIARAFRPTNHGVLLGTFGSNWLIILFVLVIAAFAMFPVTAVSATTDAADDRYVGQDSAWDLLPISKGTIRCVLGRR